MEFIDTGPVLLGILLVESILISSFLHLFIKKRWVVGLATALITVATIITIDSFSVGFFEKELLLGIVPGLVVSFVISYLVSAVLWMARRNKV